MSKRQHWFIIALWVVVLMAMVVIFQDRLFPGSGGKPATGASGNTASQPALATNLPVHNKATVSPADRLHQAIKAKNPAYNGGGKFMEKDGKIVVADLSATGIVDLSPIGELPLIALDVKGNPLSDLAPIKGMALQKLGLEGTIVADLSPLAGMPLVELYLNNTPVRDISPLKGLPLKILNLYHTDVEDISALAGMPLSSLWLNATRVKDISPLRGCPLESLTIEGLPVTDLSPLAGGKLKRLHIGQSDVTDLTPIGGLPLTRLIFTPGRIKQGMDVARKMQSITEIGTTFENRMPPAIFWQLYDQGKLEKTP